MYGFPALAAALDRGVRIGAVPTPAGGTLRVDLPAWNVKLTAADDHQLATALAAIADALQLGRPPVTLVGEAQIPPGAGLGASAAFAVAIARALIDFRARRDAPRGTDVPPPPVTEVIEAANASEAIVHGRASGVDVALATYGGVGVFRKTSGLKPIQIPALRVLVGPSGAPRSTAAMVERVAQMTSASDDDARLRELGNLTDSGTSALLGKDLVGLGRAMDRAHALLGELGVATLLLDGLCEAARRAGAYGAKLTGAGGGGAGDRDRAAREGGRRARRVAHREGRRLRRDDRRARQVSERFLEGFAVDPGALDAMIGTPKLAAKAIRSKLRGKSVLGDIDMTLGEGDAKAGKPLVDAALDVLAKGRPGTADSTYALTRVTTLILHAHAKRLGTIEVPYVEGDSFGLWNPVFRALVMPTLAKEYGCASLGFPHAKRAAKIAWPIMTLVAASLPRWCSELAGDWAKRLPQLPAAPFTDKKYGTSPERIAATKVELVAALKKLATWATSAARAKRSLVLVLDGDR